MIRQINAAYDDEGIYVYQAFTPAIVRAALHTGTFGTGFSLDRMTWIKPSFGWMLYRSGYATKPNQEAILKIKLSHEGFQTILRRSVESIYDPQQYPDESAWKNALMRSEVRHQWDPDRHPNGQKLERRAIQIGIRGETVRSYVDDWIIALEEVTALAHAVHQAVTLNHTLPNVPQEQVYLVDDAMHRRLGITV